MPKEFSRTQRLAEQIQRELATLIQFEIKDPRVCLVTVQDVTLSKDLSVAKVYVSSLDEKNSIEDTIAALNNAAGFLRHALGKLLTLRKVPELRFFFDDTVLRARELSSLIDNAVANDQSKNEESR